MRACRNASIVFFVIASPFVAFGACRDPERPETPPVTAASAPPAEPTATATETALATDAGPAKPPPVADAPVKAQLVEKGATVEVGPSLCTRVLVAAVRGPITVTTAADPKLRDTLAAGDVGWYEHMTTLDVKGTLAVVAMPFPQPLCKLDPPIVIEHGVVKASAAPELRFAKGAMSAHLDVGTKVSPELYLGRLEGTAAVPEHDHPSSWEILATVEASGAFTLDGVEQRLGPKQIVIVPPGAKHAWKPDPGSKLVAIQMYSPPGPEQRFVALAAAEKDGGK